MEADRADAASDLPPSEAEGRPAAVAATQRAVDPGVAEIDSAALFAGACELRIAHRGDTYRLRKTSLGKLILTK